MSVQEHPEQAHVPTGETVVDEYLDLFEHLLDGLDRAAVLRVVDVLRAARESGRSVFVAGNGGSAATASHFVNDLAKATRRAGRAPIRARCLSDNTSWLTALANDEGYERVFTGQLENFAVPGDVVFVISASGNSPNVVHAVEFAHDHGLVAVGLLGFDGGRLKGVLDEVVCVESEQGLYGPVETVHSLVCDLITTCLSKG